MKKRLFAFVLTAVMLLGTAVTPTFAVTEGLENFKKVNTYAEQFADVASGAWYHDVVAAAYEYGLMKGSADDAFNPDGNVTIAEALALAARLHSIYYGNGGEFQQGAVWYQVYVDYAIENDIIWDDQFSDYTAKADRNDFAEILASALPASALPVINHVTLLPDVKRTNPYAPAIFLLYNAGILSGSDERGTFNPGSNIKRCEVAAIIVRMADTTERKTLTIGQEMTATEFLTDLVKTEGVKKQYDSGEEYYSLQGRSYTGLVYSNGGDPYESELMLYLETEGYFAISMWDGLPDGNSWKVEYYNELRLQNSPNGPYVGSGGYALEGERSRGTLSIDPATFNENTTVQFSDFDGDASERAAMEEDFVNTMCNFALPLMEQYYLIPYGYSLADLGFTSMD